METEFSKRVIDIDIEREMKNSFISYAMAVIINRALPDVRDGLKPVHRRILYSMYELNITPDKPYRKCARIVGDVLGKYHPHGDSAVYDSMVRMAQPFSMRYLLVDGQGNFGSVDGDSAAAMRYTEAKLSKISMEMLSDIEKETVDFYPNFDETLMQPTVLPSRYPSLLVNGSGGIAVGMATNIPPHNLGETIDATIALIDDPDIELSELMKHIKAPDFPTGGIIMGLDGVRQAYATGRGRVIIRAKAEIEAYSANKERIIVTEIPYQVNKARLIERIAELVQEKKLEGIADLRDESDKSGMRIVIELKRDVSANVTLNALYKHTKLQDSFGIIMLALVDGTPKVLTLKETLSHYVEHQKDVVIRRSKYELERAKARAHILQGLLIALDNIDAIVDLIKKSPTPQEAKARLIQAFSLSEKQAQAVLDMRLQRLTGLERTRLEAEMKELSERIAYLDSILSDKNVLMGIIKQEMLAVREKYADERRSEISMFYGDINIEDIIQEEDMVVTLTHFGYIKRVQADSYRSQRRGGKGISGLSTREEDFVEHIFVTTTHKPIMFFTSKGRVFRLKCYELPESSRQAKGQAIVNLLQLQPEEKITAVFPVDDHEAGKYLMLATRRGIIKKTHLDEYINIRTGGLRAINIREDDELIGVLMTGGDDQLILGTRLGYGIRFRESDIRPVGRIAMGVRGISLRKGDELIAMSAVTESSNVLVISENGYGKRTPISEYTLQRRGGMGVKAMQVTQKTGYLAGLSVVEDDDDIIMISDEGIIIRTPAEAISIIGRNTQGVRVMRLPGDASVVCVALAKKEEEEEEELPIE